MKCRIGVLERIFKALNQAINERHGSEVDGAIQYVIKGSIESLQSDFNSCQQIQEEIVKAALPEEIIENEIFENMVDDICEIRIRTANTLYSIEKKDDKKSSNNVK